MAVGGRGAVSGRLAHSVLEPHVPFLNTQEL